MLDTTVLVSAFLRPVAGGAAFDLLMLAQSGDFELVLSRPILAETTDVLLNRQRLRRRYRYPDTAVTAFIDNLSAFATIVSDLPALAVVRDPKDDVILATAVAARSDFLVTRDKDLLVLDQHDGIEILSPEAVLARLRQ